MLLKHATLINPLNATYFPKKKENNFMKEVLKCNHCKNPLSTIEFHLYHIEALAHGGTNHHANIQVLCITCHSDKRNSVKEQGCVQLIHTESSVDTVAKDMFYSLLCSSYAFNDRLVETIEPKRKATKSIRLILINAVQIFVIYQNWNIQCSLLRINQFF